MAFSTLTAIDLIPEQSLATPGLFNHIFSQISDNVGTLNQGGVPFDIASGSTWASIQLTANSNNSDYLRLRDSSGQRSTYRIGSHAGATADGLNIFDESGNTMIASFSKQSIRFFQQVVGPVFDIGGALSSTLNAATFGSATDSIETRIQAAINAASQQAISRVYVPASMYPYSASSVSFIQTVQMVREGGDYSVHDVWAYGAAGNNIRDDTAAIQSAESNAGLAGGGCVYIPPGTYKTSAAIRVAHNNMTLKGAGDLLSIISSVNTVGGHIIHIPSVGGGDWYRSPHIDGLFLLGAVGGGVGLYLTDVLDGTFENLRIYSTGSHAVRIGSNGGGQCVENTFRKLAISSISSGAHAIYFAEACTTAWFEDVIIANLLNPATSDGFRLEPIAGAYVSIFISRGAVQGCRTGIHANSCRALNISTHFENNKNDVFIGTTGNANSLTRGFTLVGCYADGSASGASTFLDTQRASDGVVMGCAIQGHTGSAFVNTFGGGNDSTFLIGNYLNETTAYGANVVDWYQIIPSVLNSSVSITGSSVSLVGSILQETWQTPTLLHSWSNAGGSYETAGYFKDREGTVHVKGVITSGTTADGTSLFTLASGYRPAAIRPFLVSSNLGTSVGVQVRSTGAIEINGNSAVTVICLDGIEFRP